MRPVKEISSKQENFRIESIEGFSVIKRDFVVPESIGTIVLIPFRVTRYGVDCDGSALARLAHINNKGEETGWTQNCIGLYPTSALVVSEQELNELFEGKENNK